MPQHETTMSSANWSLVPWPPPLATSKTVSAAPVSATAMPSSSSAMKRLSSSAIDQSMLNSAVVCESSALTMIETDGSATNVSTCVVQSAAPPTIISLWMPARSHARRAGQLLGPPPAVRAGNTRAPNVKRISAGVTRPERSREHRMPAYTKK